MEYNDSNFVNEKNEYENQIVDSETKQYDNSCEAYQDFSNIIKHSDFNISDVLYFIITIKKYQNSLPLIPFNGYDIELNDRNIFSTLKLTHQVFVFQLKRTLQHIMLNPSLRDQMYFGSGIYYKIRQELWHGNIWHKSLLFGTTYIYVNNEMSILLLTIDELLLMDMKKPDNYDYCIDEIVYKSNNKWNTQLVDLCHKHPIEYIPIRDGNELPVFKFFLDIYIDKFEPFHNAYHAIGGIYLQIGNMMQVIHQKLKNHFLLKFILFDANCNDVLKPIIEDIKELENGFEMDLDNKCIWITGGLENITSDLPKGNEQAEIKNHNANHGCHICTSLFIFPFFIFYFFLQKAHISETNNLVSQNLSNYL
ncbi:hypothetical protein GLOIN_2v1785823 [Rhizophagus irregularis DAOM 181602=DAOM 197198]|nr:hypothetical protein GLOIN_2v1785823 [Rhizophagus irregularis DAOM 181602=DAOM 197198]